MANGFYKVVKGYTAQARWYAANMKPSTAEGDWTDAGWTKLGNGAVKPVYLLNNNLPVCILQGKDHLTVIVSEVPAACVFATEDAAHATKNVW